MHNKPVIWMVLLLLAFSRSAFGADAFEYGPRPPLSVFDPTGILPQAVTVEISEKLDSIHKKEGVDVIVVILPDLGPAPPEHVAELFADAWCVSVARCVVLHTPGRDGSPWIVPGKKLMGDVEPQKVTRMIEDARRRASAEAKEADKVKAAADEAMDMIRFRSAHELNRKQARLTESTRLRLELETKSRQTRIFILGSLAAFIPLVMGLALLVNRLRRLGPGYFPHHAWQLRLGAPHAGGNHAVVDLPPPSPPKS